MNKKKRNKTRLIILYIAKLRYKKFRMTNNKKQENMNESQKKEALKQNLKAEVKKLLTQETKWTKESSAYDHFPANEKPFPIEPYPNERQRLPFKMSEEDRQRRRIWVKSQELTEREPVRVPELEQMIYNPIRRLYRGPTDRLFQALTPILGQHRVPLFRMIIPKLFLGYVGACVIWYNFKYNNGVRFSLIFLLIIVIFCFFTKN